MMKTWIVSVPALALLACGGKPEQDAQPESVAAAMRQAAAAIESNAGTAVTPVTPEELLKRLPSSIAGMSRNEAEKQTMSPAGVGISIAKATYQGEGRRRVEISMTDMGGIGMAAGAGVAWAVTDFDRTTATGYQRTTRIHGFKAMESQKRQGGILHSELAVVAGARFLVQLQGTEVGIDVLKSTLDDLDIRSLASQR
jgi:hypothetical protein